MCYGCPLKREKSNIYKKSKAWRDVKFSVLMHGWENAAPVLPENLFRVYWVVSPADKALLALSQLSLLSQKLFQTRHIFGRSWCRALFSWSAHRPLGKSHHGLIQAAQQQKTFPPGEDKTFSNLPFHNSITQQRFCKNVGETHKAYPWGCNTHFQMSSRRQTDHIWLFPDRLCGRIHTQSRHLCNYNLYLPNPSPWRHVSRNPPCCCCVIPACSLQWHLLLWSPSHCRLSPKIFSFRKVSSRTDRESNFSILNPNYH